MAEQSHNVHEAPTRKQLHQLANSASAHNRSSLPPPPDHMPIPSVAARIMENAPVKTEQFGKRTALLRGVEALEPSDDGDCATVATIQDLKSQLALLQSEKSTLADRLDEERRERASTP